MNCRQGCGACCIEPQISSALPLMPEGKPAGVPCAHLRGDMTCDLFGDHRRPQVCSDFRASHEHCGENREEALDLLRQLERATGGGSL